MSWNQIPFSASFLPVKKKKTPTVETTETLIEILHLRSMPRTSPFFTLELIARMFWISNQTIKIAHNWFGDFQSRAARLKDKREEEEEEEAIFFCSPWFALSAAADAFVPPPLLHFRSKTFPICFPARRATETSRQRECRVMSVRTRLARNSYTFSTEMRKSCTWWRFNQRMEPKTWDRQTCHEKIITFTPYN